jgi:hypothetical protein
VQRVAPRLPLLLSNAFELMCLFCAPGTHDQKCTVVPFISTCYFARVVANTLCDVGFASRSLRFCVTRILGMGVPMTRDSIESWIKSHILSLRTSRVTYFELEVRAWPLQGFTSTLNGAGPISSIHTLKQ